LRYFTLVCDYDGTLAHDGQVSDQVIRSLERLLSSGRKLIMVTGRKLDDLKQCFHHIDLFERVVAENGALLYRPADHGIKNLAEPPPPEFIAELGRRGVHPVSVGNSIVSTWQPHETIVLEAIRDFGLEMQVIFNKGAVMVLPSGVNKATGLREALTELRLSRHNAVGVGDAENDHAFLSLCECAVAVANALPMIKGRCDLVTNGDHGLGVIELIDRILATDLSEIESRSVTHAISIGTRADGQDVYFNPYGINVLLAGSSQGGKTTLATGIIERLVENDYQLCVIDPEGDYSSVEGVVSLGDRERIPSADEVLEILAKPEESVVCSLLGLALEHRPSFFVELFPRLQEMRARTGRPHWIIIDEAHHLLPSSWEPVPLTFPHGSAGMMFITLNAEHVARVILSTVDTIIAIGEAPEKTIHTFCDTVGERRLPLAAITLNTGEAIVWSRRTEDPIWIKTHPPRSERRRHHRKYAKGELAPELSFYFRGPEDKLKLRAQNLVVFLQLADGVDDETWLYHLRRDEYSRWFREVIKDEELAEEAAVIEQQQNISADESRKLIRAAIEQRYTAPA
jgi:hydroxymethylpyrimidine pyrophosphatase-like HAD family hydrolase